MVAAGLASITTGPSPMETLAANDLRAAKPAPAAVAPAAEVAKADDVIQVRHLIAPGETFVTILVGEGVSAIEARAWEQAAASAYDVDAVQPRHALVITFSRDGHELRACDYEIDKYALLSMRVAHGQVQARLKAMPQLAAVRGVVGRVEASLAASASAAGIPARMVSQLADVFGWEVDLETDVRRGDEFRLVYAEVRDDSGTAHPGDILAAEITSHGRTLRAIRFENEKGESEYYDPQGHAIGKGFLKYPLEFDYVSSQFGARMHPVLKRPAQHMGVDFAAPIGTPVRAVASGVVTFAGYAHGYGNQVGIDHQAPYATSYSHLRRIAKGLRVGAEVRKGQVIGYVGRSGLATGPHLHFMLFIDGTYVNPLTVKLPASEQLAGARRFQFAVLSHELLDRLAALTSHVELPSVSFATPADVLRPNLSALD